MAIGKNARKRAARKAFAESRDSNPDSKFSNMPNQFRIQVRQGDGTRCLVFASLTSFRAWLGTNHGAKIDHIQRQTRRGMFYCDEFGNPVGATKAAQSVSDNKSIGLRSHPVVTLPKGGKEVTKQRRAIDGYKVHSYADGSNNPYSGIIAEQKLMITKRAK